MRFFPIRSSDGELQVSRVILGTTHFGTKVTDNVTFDILDRYAALGGTTIDTARVYGDWGNTGNAASERVVGQWLRECGRRSDFVLITKGAHHRIERPIKPRVTPDCIRGDLELSLENIGGGIDLYLLHRDDPSVPVAEIMPVLHEYVKSGDIRAIGCSNWSRERMDEANRFAETHSMTPFSANEIQWSLAMLDRETLDKLFGSDVFGVNAGEYHKYLHSDISLLSFTSIAWGYFTKLIEGTESPYIAALESAENRRRADVVRKWCKQTSLSPAAIAVSYITSHPFIRAAACVGCSNTEQVSDFMAAGDVVLPRAFFEEIGDTE